MARNGNGTYILPPSNPVVSGTVIESDWANDTMADLAAALSQSIAYDGQTTPIANLPMGGFHHLNTGDPTSRNQYATLGMVQDNRHTRVSGITGVDNLVGTLIGGATSYMAGSLINFFAPATNTGSMTMNYNGIGARSLTDQNGLALAPGAMVAGQFNIAVYTGTEFRLLGQVNAAVAADLYNLSITGQIRPPSNVYPSLTIATATSINVPAGSAWINPPGNDPDDAVNVSWPAQTIVLQFLASSFTTFIMVDATGSIQQIPGRAIGANFRSMAVLGVVEHITGTVNNVITRPSIFGDDGYRNRDAASLLANTIANGGLVTPNAVSLLNLDVAQGTIFIPGGTANTVDSPNTFNIPPQANIQFRTLAGQNTLSGLTSAVPVANYDLNGAGVVAALPNPGDATIHRLYYIYGQYVLAYGQQAYGSVENALSMIAWDRTKYRKSLYLADATLMAEIVAIRTATNLNLIAQAAVVCPGGINFSIGSPGGIAEAPIDGFPYGRRNAAWFQVLGSVSPSATVDATITGIGPRLREVVSPANTAGTSGLEVFNAANKWFTIESVLPDDKTYFRSYNPASGALRFTTTYDLATGRWTVPKDFQLGGASARILSDFSTAAPSQALRTFFQTTTLNETTFLSSMPNGTGVQSSFLHYARSDPDNSEYALFGCATGEGLISVNKTGTGVQRPLNIYVGSKMLGIEPTGQLDLPGVSRRITSDFSTATPSQALRTFFQTTVPNGTTYISSMPNGAGVQSATIHYARSDPDNSEYAFFGCNTGEGVISLEKSGAAPAIPLSIYVGGELRMRFHVGGVTDILGGVPGANGIIEQGNQDLSISRYNRIALGSHIEYVNHANNLVTQILADNGEIISANTTRPAADGSGNCGRADTRWATVYAITGTINTSDARMKTPVSSFTPNEVAAAKELSKEIGTFKWLESIEKKGADARTHIGMTVQRAMEIMVKHGLEPMRYGFICYDEWEEDPATIDHREIKDENGEVTGYEDVVMKKAVPAGDRYSFRYDQLNLFIARGLAQRLADIEARMGL